MKKGFLLLLFTFCIFSIHAQINSGDGFRIPGDWNSFTNNHGMGGDFDCNLITAGNQRWQTSFEYTGVTGDQTFKMASGGSGSPWFNQWYFGAEFVEATVTMNTIEAVGYTVNGGSSNSKISVTNGNWYTFNWEDEGYTGTNAVFMETSAEPVTVDAVAGNYHTNGVAVTITATINKAKSAEEKVILRYTTDAWASSSFVEATCTGMSCTANIPAGDVMADANHQLYVLTTTVGTGTLSHINSDMYTINLNNNSGSNYTIGTAPILPVQLTKFTATPQNNQVSLDWQTATELNNSHFTIERSTTGSDFETIGTVQGVGTTVEIQNYNFIDPQPANGMNYYRLKQVDFNGDFEYSDLAVIKFQTKQNIQVFPNPVKEQINIQADLGQTNILIYNMQGQLLREMNNISINGQFTFNLSDLNTGLYQIQILDPSTRTILLQERIVKQ